MINALKIAEAMDRDHGLSEGNAGVMEMLRQQLAALDAPKRKPGP